ncbi:MAG: 16S rRNA (cytosine(1402)-N(4))-methyltransferase RsmH [Bacteroidia bacterium]|jgi:16S rRNA (cytosine1402-N4)-methyltransferase|nr:16S rRNA (cytosine(1402)-N(4))-methyltransferase RsmH [Bacteroidia bacterium]
MTTYHVPVMLKECMEGLNIQPDGKYVDVTFGGGGHSKAILSALSSKGRLVAFDQDQDAQRNLLLDDKRFVFIDQNFEFISNHLAYQELLPIDGLLADLGVSSHQFDTDERGFSFRFDDAALDMRMNTSIGKGAAEVIASYTEAQLADLFYQYGELNQSRKLAHTLVSKRTIEPIQTVGDLKKALQAFAPQFKDYKFWAQVFQALRIEVNRELEVLKQLLLQASEVLAPGGRLVIMSYHSLEDRLVKNFINTGNFNGEVSKDFFGNIIRPLEPISKKAITASELELETNPRSRSAKLRIAQKLTPYLN